MHAHPEPHFLILPDGRQLAYVVYGAEGGRPLLYCHGFPASRLEGRMMADAARALDIRLIVPDRPGYGLSDFRHADSLGDWAEDLKFCADALGLGRFPLLGVSGGGPYALAAAERLGDRIAVLGLVCALGPVYEPSVLHAMQWPARVGFVLAQRRPALLPLVYGGLSASLLRRYPALVEKLLTVSSPASDREVLTTGGLGQALRDWVQEALRQGPRAALQDFRRYALPWLVDWQRLRRPVLLWHGTADATVPLRHSQRLAELLPHAHLRVLPGEGHFSLPVHHAKAILRELMGQPDAGPPA